MADSDSFETCPTDIVHASSEQVWELLTDPARLDWVGVKLVQSPAHHLAVGDRLSFRPVPGLDLSWKVLALEPLHTLELGIKAPLGIRNHEVVVVSPLSGDKCRVTFN